MTLPSRLALSLVACLAACSSTVTSVPPDAPSDVSLDSAVDGGDFCTLPLGGRCPRGATCPAGDGCNTCACLADGTLARCTLIGCVAPDAGPVGCASSADCRDGNLCQFLTPGCAVRGTCGALRDCAFLGDYCGCDGVTFRDCAGGAVASPYVSAGVCPADDAGVAPSCAGARIGRDGRSCVGAADEPLALACCTWNCDVRTAACASLPPRCPDGEANTVAGGCWGPCVAPTACATMPCAADNTCVAPWRCAPASGTCVFAG